MYKIHPSLKGHHITTVDGVPVVLGENAKTYPRQVIKDGVVIATEAKPATQAQLKAIHERGDKTIAGYHLVIKMADQESVKKDK